MKNITFSCHVRYILNKTKVVLKNIGCQGCYKVTQFYIVKNHETFLQN